MGIHATAIGNLGADAEFKYINGSSDGVLELRLACNDRQKVGGEWKDVPTWVRASVFGKRAESLAKLGLTKGTKVAVVGPLVVREYDRKEGGKGHSVEIRASEVELLGGKRDEEGPPRRTETRPAEADASGSGGGEAEDDIPF